LYIKDFRKGGAIKSGFPKAESRWQVRVDINSFYLCDKGTSKQMYQLHHNNQTEARNTTQSREMACPFGFV